MEENKIKTAILALTPLGAKNAALLSSVICGTLFLPEKLKTSQISAHYYSYSFSEMATSLFSRAEQLIFVMATGIVVRTLAPIIKSKFYDPAVIVMDENLRFAISLLSGHVGGANDLALEIEEKIGSIPVITTATDVNDFFAADVLAKELNSFDVAQKELYKQINTAFLWKKKIAIWDDCTIFEDCRKDKLEKKKEPFSQEPYFLKGAWISSRLEKLMDLGRFDYLICISYREPWIFDLERIADKDNILHLAPKNLVLGTGCRKDLNPSVYEEEFDKFMNRHQIPRSSISLICSIDKKKNEKAIQGLANSLGVNFQCYEANKINEALQKIEGYEKSYFVQEKVGTLAVAHPCAYIGSGGRVIVTKEKGVSSTFSLGQKAYRYNDGHFRLKNDKEATL